MLQVDAVPVCIATTMADVISIELTTPARSDTSGATDDVARMLETIHLSQLGQMLRADARHGPLGTNEHQRRTQGRESHRRTGIRATTRGDLAISLHGKWARRLNDPSDLFLADVMR